MFCLVLKLSYFMFFFKMDMGGHLEFRGQYVSKSRNKHFIGFVTPKIVEFITLYLHIYAYILISSKKLAYFFS